VKAAFRNWPHYANTIPLICFEVVKVVGRPSIPGTVAYCLFSVFVGFDFGFDYDFGFGLELYT
jgi:hypothetical protein